MQERLWTPVGERASRGDGGLDGPDSAREGLRTCRPVELPLRGRDDEDHAANASAVSGAPSNE